MTTGAPHAASAGHEVAGVDISEHAESAYDFEPVESGYAEVATRGDDKDRVPAG